MFPLGTVALPGAALPLRIFEPRYQQLLADVVSGDGTFGVVLIERGNEVGGGDARSDIGTLVRVIQHESLGGGQHGVLAIGVERIRVDQWLPDDPYPRSHVTAWPDEDRRDINDGYNVCTRALRDLLTTATEFGFQVTPPDFQAPEDPVAGSYLLAALTPVGAFDKQRLLSAPGAQDRLDLLTAMIEDQLALIAHNPPLSD